MATALATYLFDRVKWCDRWLDPADPLAHPERHALLWPRRRIVRVVAVLGLAVAAALGWWLGTSNRQWSGGWLAILPVLSVLGAWCYGGRPRRSARRPKDHVVLKNLAVGVSIAAFAVVLALAAATPGISPIGLLGEVRDPRAAMIGVALVLRVTADAILCDLDDAEVDRRFGTDSLPARFGRHATLLTAVASTVAAGGLAALATPDARGEVWGGLGIAGALLLVGIRPDRMRDLAEIRLPFEVVLLAIWFGPFGG